MVSRLTIDSSTRTFLDGCAATLAGKPGRVSAEQHAYNQGGGCLGCLPAGKGSCTFERAIRDINTFENAGITHYLIYAAEKINLNLTPADQATTNIGLKEAAELLSACAAEGMKVFEGQGFSFSNRYHRRQYQQACTQLNQALENICSANGVAFESGNTARNVA